MQDARFANGNGDMICVFLVRYVTAAFVTTPEITVMTECPPSGGSA